MAATVDYQDSDLAGCLREREREGGREGGRDDDDDDDPEGR